MKDLKENIYKQCLTKLDKANWSDQLVIESISDLNIDKNYFEILFKSDINNVIGQYIVDIDQKMLDEINNNDAYQSLSVSKKVLEALRIRFLIIKQDKNIIRKNTIYYSTPNNYLKASKSAWIVADKIWKIAGDKSTDFNYYSKRSILASIYSTAILYWLNEKSDDVESTLDYIERSIKRLASIGKVKGKINSFFKS